jgi:hypothetical protein
VCWRRTGRDGSERRETGMTSLAVKEHARATREKGKDRPLALKGSFFYCSSSSLICGSYLMSPPLAYHQREKDDRMLTPSGRHVCHLRRGVVFGSQRPRRSRFAPSFIYGRPKAPATPIGLPTNIRSRCKEQHRRPRDDPERTEPDQGLLPSRPEKRRRRAQSGVSLSTLSPLRPIYSRCFSGRELTALSLTRPRRPGLPWTPFLVLAVLFTLPSSFHP